MGSANFPTLEEKVDADSEDSEEENTPKVVLMTVTNGYDRLY